MSRPIPNVYTLAPGENALRLIAEQIAAGFPLESRGDLPLSSWTILLPTRRAARQLGRAFHDVVGGKSIILPRIKPIGDIDDDLLTFQLPEGDAPEAIPSTGLLFVLMRLVENWAMKNRDRPIASDILASPQRKLGLAQSLLKLVNQTETEEIALDNIGDAIKATGLADHRETIIDLIKLIPGQLRDELDELKLIGPAARRNLIIRLEADRIRSGKHEGPIIAAGSTGTNPATRDLLAAIAMHPQGAVILPGLDPWLSDADWDTLDLPPTPTHPQFGLSKLVKHLGIDRHSIRPIGHEKSPRSWLASELMRPSATTDQWVAALDGQQERFEAARLGLTLVEADDRHIEARAIALILREALETPQQTAALITPDRELALRVKSELLRWNVVIDDTGGEPLTRFGLASLLSRLADCVLGDFSPISIVGLLHHDLADFGMGKNVLVETARAVEVAALRAQGVASAPDGVQRAFEAARSSFADPEERTHPVIARIKPHVWDSMAHLVKLLTALFETLADPAEAMLGDHIDCLVAALTAIAPDANRNLKENVLFQDVLDDLRDQQIYLGRLTLVQALPLILSMLRQESFRTHTQAHPRLAIYGLLEARMMRVDIAVLGGLNEGVWPTQPNPGPWINRTMRDELKLQQPEREIGLTAHDLVAALGHPRVHLTWAKRAGREPLVPSRWIQRLRAIMKGFGIELENQADATHVAIARHIDDVPDFKPHVKPQPKPPVADRPTRFSVTDVEKLIRDPYHIYARKVLKLQPLDLLSDDPDARMRGTIFHAAFEAWNRLALDGQTPAPLEALIAAGREAFDHLAGDAEVQAFWWPRFVRLARWLYAEELSLRESMVRLYPEIRGELSFEIDSTKYTLSAIADRIDLLDDGSVRIVDYKTGQAPSNQVVKAGINPQMTLEAAMLQHGAFKDLNSRVTREAIYLRVTGGRPPGELKRTGEGREHQFDVADLATLHFEGLKKKLETFRHLHVPYTPRTVFQKVDQPGDFDHLSRYREWSLVTV